VEVDLKLARRDSKIATRSYVLVNPALAKHLPATPSEAIYYFTQLGKKIAAVCGGERVLVIGFAETATAVGATVASMLDNAVYVHTTREVQLTEPGNLIADFFEEHSHAKNQSLYLGEAYSDLSGYGRIVFVEDEITTGKTILNFLRQIEFKGKLTVSALVFNGFDESVFARYNADFFCLQKTGYVHYLAFDKLPNPRMGVDIEEYREKCADLVSQIITAVRGSDVRDKDVLVLGTEEFMYPALLLGCALESMAKSVKSHATTRSPLLPRRSGDYPLYSRCDFSSEYDSARTTFLYNLETYDTVIVVTDAPAADCGDFIRAIQNQGNQIIYYVRV